MGGPIGGGKIRELDEASRGGEPENQIELVEGRGEISQVEPEGGWVEPAETKSQGT